MHPAGPFALVLGSAQDAGVPQAGCSCSTCRATRAGQLAQRLPASLGLIDPQAGLMFLIDATPAFPQQLAQLEAAAIGCRFAGIVLTHAHIGHYTGLMHLGREVMDTRGMPVFCSRTMADFLARNAPWRQFIEHGNIVVQPIAAATPLHLTPQISLSAQAVPHRAEWSDTFAFTISGPQRRVFYCPDIDRWQDWSHDIGTVTASVDVALLDGTFFSGAELPGRDMQLIPHPTVIDSMARLAGSRSDIRFIHFNHTNPLLVDGHTRADVEQRGFGLAVEGQIIPL